MPLPIIADVFRTVLTWNDSSTGLKAHNVMHFKTTASGKTAAQVTTCLQAHVVQAMWDWAAATAIVTELAVTPLDGVSAAVLTGTGSPAKWTGGGGAGALPQVAGEVKFSTALRGPAHRGRIMIPFVAEGEVSGRTLTDVAAVAAAWATFATDISADATTPMTLRVASYAHATSQLVIGFAAQSTTYTVGKRNPH